MPEQLILLLIIGAFSIGKWVLDQLAKAKEEQGSREEPRSQSPKRTPIPSREEDEAERVRRFMEALGLPPGETPPKPTRPRPESAPVAPAAPPPVPEPVRPVSSFPQPPPAPARPASPFPPRPKPEPVPEPRVLPVEVFRVPQTVTQSVAPVVPAAPEPVLEISLPPRSEASRAYRKRPRSASAPMPLRKALRDPVNVRQAVLLREILGPPKGMARE